MSTKWLGIKKQPIVHIALLVLSLAWLPIALHTDIAFSSSEHPIPWVIVSLFLSIGVPFFVLAANAPLIQFWLANTSHKDAKNPYFLYSASNIGSLLALLSYPFLIEPTLTLWSQTHAWSLLFAGFIALIVASAVYLRKYPATVPADQSARADEATPPLKTKLYWMALAAGPSSLMLGLTTYITTDIAPIPLFWVIPLALYLITFIAAFSKYDKITDYAVQAQNILVPLTVMGMVFNIQLPYGLMILHVLTFFVTAMVCHGTLARRKPGTRHLTEFYVWMSLGGMLGGVFNALVVPFIFTNPIEYTVLFFACLLLRPTIGHFADSKREWKKDILIPIVFGAVMLAVFYGAFVFMDDYEGYLRTTYDKTHTLSTSETFVASNMYFIFMTVVYIAIMVMVDRTYQRPLRFMLVVLALFFATTYSVRFGDKKDDLIYAERNFFGVLRIYRYEKTTQLMHGTTTHGMQSNNPKEKLWLTSYYTPLTQMFQHLDRKIANAPYAVIGLGSGTSACAGRKGQVVDFYDIDPAVVKMANNPEFFTYLRDCPTTHNIILGDGRLQIAKANDKRYGLIVVDAFSSDAIPLHLLTREAIAIYASKLADNGVIALHISNRYLDLMPLTAALALDGNFQAIVVHGGGENTLAFGSVWVLLTRDAQYYARGKKEKNWQQIKSKGTFKPWTDDYSNILHILQ